MLTAPDKLNFPETFLTKSTCSVFSPGHCVECLASVAALLLEPHVLTQAVPRSSTHGLCSVDLPCLTLQATLSHMGRLTASLTRTAIWRSVLLYARNRMKKWRFQTRCRCVHLVA